MNPDVCKAVLNLDGEYWPLLQQLVKILKPLVDMIRNLESQQTTLADCMLELIRCAREMYCIPLAQGDDVGFWMHAKSVFNTEFHRMNTDSHNLALFLHPMCQKIAVGQAAKSRKLTDITKAALEIAKQWRWTEVQAHLLCKNIWEYYHSKGPFVGAVADARTWWLDLDLPSEKYPIRILAVKLHSIVLHAAEVECLFSTLSGVQGQKSVNLTVDNFERRGKMRSNYAYHLYE